MPQFDILFLPAIIFFIFFIYLYLIFVFFISLFNTFFKIKMFSKSFYLQKFLILCIERKINLLKKLISIWRQKKILEEND